MLRPLPVYIRVSLFHVSVCAGMLILERVFFAVFASARSEVSVTEFLHSFITGFRFDLATIPILCGVYLILLFLVTITANYRRQENGSLNLYGGQFEMTIHLLQWVYLALMNMIMMASVYNFTINNKHFGWEFRAYFRDLPALYAGVWQESKLSAIAFALFLPVWLLLYFRVIRPFYKKLIAVKKPAPDTKIQKLLRPVLTGLVLVLFIGIAGRGGIQESPIRTADAVLFDDAYLNNLPLNGLFSVSRDLSDAGDFVKFFPREENIKVTRKLIEGRDPFINENYPLLRSMNQRKLIPGQFRTVAGSTDQKPNFVFIILESWTAKFLAAHGADPEIAPYFNKIQTEGIYFKRFMASGGRSANGLFSMFAGIPDRAGRTIMRSNQIQNRFGGLALLLGQSGYSSFFLHGGDLGFDNLNRVLPHLGFTSLTGMKELTERGYTGKTPYGYHDGASFEVFYDHISKLKRPYFASIFTVNSHHPYPLPDESYRYFGDTTEEAPIKNTIRYTDSVLKEFMEKMKKRDDYKNTIFIFIADHTHHAGLNYLEDRQIPLLIYQPALFKSGVRTDLASHLDILPTILSLSGGNVQYSSMGRDLTDPESGPEHAFFAAGSNTDYIGWIEGNRILFYLIGEPNGMLLPATEPVGKKNLLDEEPQTHKLYLAKVKHFYQFARTLEEENTIWPETLE